MDIFHAKLKGSSSSKRSLRIVLYCTLFIPSSCYILYTTCPTEASLHAYLGKYILRDTLIPYYNDAITVDAIMMGGGGGDRGGHSSSSPSRHSGSVLLYKNENDSSSFSSITTKFGTITNIKTISILGLFRIANVITKTKKTITTTSSTATPATATTATMVLPPPPPGMTPTKKKDIFNKSKKCNEEEDDQDNNIITTATTRSESKSTMTTTTKTTTTMTHTFHWIGILGNWYFIGGRRNKHCR